MREIGGLEGAAEDGDGVVLGCDVVEGLWAAMTVSERLRVLVCGIVGLVLFLHPWLQARVVCL